MLLLQGMVGMLTSSSISTREDICMPEDMEMLKTANKKDLENVNTRENAENFLWVPKNRERVETYVE